MFPNERFDDLENQMNTMKATIICNVNTLRPRQNGCHFTDDSFKCIFLNENVWISNKNSLKFIPKGPIDNIPALVQIIAWCRPGNKPLSEPMVVKLPMHICITRPQWVNELAQTALQSLDFVGINLIFYAWQFAVYRIDSCGNVAVEVAWVGQYNQPYLKPMYVCLIIFRNVKLCVIILMEHTQLTSTYVNIHQCVKNLYSVCLHLYINYFNEHMDNRCSYVSFFHDYLKHVWAYSINIQYCNH